MPTSKTVLESAYEKSIDEINHSSFNIQNKTQTSRRSVIKNSIKSFLEGDRFKELVLLKKKTPILFPQVISIMFFSFLSLGVGLLSRYFQKFENIPNILLAALQLLLVFPIISIIIGACLLSMIQSICFSFHTSFFRYIFKKRKQLILYSCVFLCYGMICTFIKPDELGTTPEEKDLWKNYIFNDLIPSLPIHFFKFTILLGIRALIIDGINYMIYQKHHKQRLLEEKYTRLIIIELCNIKDGDIEDDLEFWSLDIYGALKPEGGEITEEDFRRHLSSELADIVMEIFDLDNSGGVDEREFKSIVIYSLKKLINLENAIKESERSVVSIDYLLIGILIIFGITYFRSEFLAKSNTFKDMVGWFALIGGPVIIVGGKILIDVALNINEFFVQRPFDIGDRLILGKENDLTSESIGIFSNTYTKNNMIVHSINKHQIKENIANIRKSEFENYDFTRTFLYRDIEKLKDLEHNLNEIMDNNQTYYIGRVLLKDYEISNDKVKLNIRVCFSSRNGDENWYLDNRGFFSLVLAREIEKLGLVVE